MKSLIVVANLLKSKLLFVEDFLQFLMNFDGYVYCPPASSFFLNTSLKYILLFTLNVALPKIDNLCNFFNV